jgi:hypothetical protein
MKPDTPSIGIYKDRYIEKQKKDRERERERERERDIEPVVVWITNPPLKSSSPQAPRKPEKEMITTRKQ